MTTFLWLTFAAFMLHELEEIALIKPWVSGRLTRRDPRTADHTFVRRYARIRGEVAALMIAEETVLVAVVYAITDLGDRPAAFVAMVVVNGVHLASHVVDAVRARGYTPGLVTSVLTLPVMVAAALVCWPLAAGDLCWWIVGLMTVLLANFRFLFWLEPRADRFLDRVAADLGRA